MNDGNYIVYNTDNHSLHTHTKHKRVAIKLKYLAEHRQLPSSNNEKLIESLLRITSNSTYRRKLEAIKPKSKTERGLLECGAE